MPNHSFELPSTSDGQTPVVHRWNAEAPERGAIILGHNYMEPALFLTVPDVTGDSLELARRAAGGRGDGVVLICLHASVVRDMIRHC